MPLFQQKRSYIKLKRCFSDALIVFVYRRIINYDYLFKLCKYYGLIRGISDIFQQHSDV